MMYYLVVGLQADALCSNFEFVDMVSISMFWSRYYIVILYSSFIRFFLVVKATQVNCGVQRNLLSGHLCGRVVII